MTSVTLSPVRDFAALGARWRRLEARADGSFFQSWTWTGCLAAERFPDPILAEATEAGETVALALFNRRRHVLGPDTLYLGETGIPALDRPYIEDNGVLAVTGREAALTTACLQAARFGPAAGRPRQLVLSGIDDRTLAAARRVAGETVVRHSDSAPYADLMQSAREDTDYLVRRSANTRQQLRRSDRAWAAFGPLALRRAETVAEAHAFLDELAPLHQATWTVRGEPGCFADPFFGRFHHELIDRGLPRGEIDLLRITAGVRLIGILYNFRFRGRALAYQSGFDYAGAGSRRKPGLTCHHQAIRFCTADGAGIYDFLAGGDRYKQSLSDAERSLHWVELNGVPPLWRRAVRRVAGRLMRSPHGWNLMMCVKK